MESCDVCDGVDWELISDRDRHGRPLNTGVCRGCGLVRHEKLPTDAELAEFYGREYRRAYHGETAPSARRVDRAWRNGQRILQQLQPHLSAGARVFEVGAGIGCTVKSFEFAGYPSAGIDPGVGFTNYAQRQLRARVRVADLFDLPPVPEHDLVLLVHVIEHFRSPRRALQAIRRLLVDGGRLYVECPNLAAPFARRSQLFHYAHIHNFTPQTLTLLARRCGFRVERMFSAPDDPNLQLLLARGEIELGAGDATSYTATKDALARSTGLRYHLRWDYVRRRLVKVAAYLGEHVAAGRRTARLIARAQASSSTTSMPTAHAA